MKRREFLKGSGVALIGAFTGVLGSLFAMPPKVVKKGSTKVNGVVRRVRLPTGACTWRKLNANR